MKIEWDPGKAKSNLRKHGVSFEEASTALSYPMAANVTWVRLKSIVKLVPQLSLMEEAPHDV
jgi:uncharacterized DUF497 family protein